MAKVLVVDDDADLAFATRIVLESGGHTVVEARSGKEGLEVVQQETPDLIVLDVMMDTTTAGFQMALALRSPDPQSPFSAYRSIPIVMLTAIHETTNIRFGPDENYLPVDAFMDKPIDPVSFLQKVEQLLKTAPAHE